MSGKKFKKKLDRARRRLVEAIGAFDEIRYPTYKGLSDKVDDDDFEALHRRMNSILVDLELLQYHATH